MILVKNHQTSGDGDIEQIAKRIQKAGHHNKHYQQSAKNCYWKTNRKDIQLRRGSSDNAKRQIY